MNKRTATHVIEQLSQFSQRSLYPFYVFMTFLDLSVRRPRFTEAI
jgi:hypothetical protein